MMDIYPYRHRITEGPDAGTTIVYERYGYYTYRTDDPASFDLFHRYSPTVKPSYRNPQRMTSGMLAWLESIPTYDQRQAAAQSS